MAPWSGYHTSGIDRSVDTENRIAGDRHFVLVTSDSCCVIILINRKGTAAHIQFSPVTQQVHVSLVHHIFPLRIACIHEEISSGDGHLRQALADEMMGSLLIEETRTVGYGSEYLRSGGIGSASYERTAADVHLSAYFDDIAPEPAYRGVRSRCTCAIRLCLGEERTAGDIHFSVLCNLGRCSDPCRGGYRISGYALSYGIRFQFSTGDVSSSSLLH